MGVVARGQGRLDEAETWYRQALQLDAKGCAAQYNLGVLYQDHGGGGPERLRKARAAYHAYASCAGPRDPRKVADAAARVRGVEAILAGGAK